MRWERAVSGAQGASGGDRRRRFQDCPGLEEAALLVGKIKHDPMKWK